MPAEVILFEAKFGGKLSAKRTVLPTGAMLLIVLLVTFFPALLLSTSYLAACVWAIITTAVAWPLLILIRYKTRPYTLQLTSEVLRSADRHGHKDVLLQLASVAHFRYYAISFDEDDHHRVLQAITSQGIIDLPLSALTRSKEKQLLLSLRHAGFTVFLVYENQELGYTYPGI